MMKVTVNFKTYSIFKLNIFIIDPIQTHGISMLNYMHWLYRKAMRISLANNVCILHMEHLI